MRSFALPILVCAAVLILMGCKTPTSQVINTSPATNQPARPHVTHVPVDSANVLYLRLHDRSGVLNFYNGRDHLLAWDVLGDSMATIINNVRYSGLLPRHYHSDELKHIKGLGDSLSVVRTDILLTDAFLTLAGHLQRGKTVQFLKNDSSALYALSDVLLHGGLKTKLDSLEPHCTGYRRLRKALGMLIDTSEVREMLLTGTLSDTNSVFATVRCIEINMERWRKSCTYPDPFLRIEVNIPSFMLHVWLEDSITFDSKVIVGAVKSPTPELTSAVDCIVLYPYWHVPRKIAVEEFLSFIKRDTSFLTRNNMEVLDRKGNILNPDSLAWEKFSKNYFPITLRQREGTENSLGIVKFEFDNPYAVYLHDTNAKRLFRNKTRAYSHGCVRMEKALALAHYLATGSTVRESTAISNFIRNKTRHTVALKNPVPIRITYFTCDVLDDELRIYDDIYHLDERIIKALYISPAPDDEENYR